MRRSAWEGTGGRAVALAVALLLGACGQKSTVPDVDDFPAAQRPVAPLGTSPCAMRTAAIRRGKRNR